MFESLKANWGGRDCLASKVSIHRVKLKKGRGGVDPKNGGVNGTIHNITGTLKK